jgi:hypothetical protein
MIKEQPPPLGQTEPEQEDFILNLSDCVIFS